MLIKVLQFRQSIARETPGPWATEADLVEFESYGLRCLVSRHIAGHLCGFVAVPEFHPWHSLVEPPAIVHGGITYARENGPASAMERGWWIGFDCSHVSDFSPLKAILSHCDNHCEREQVQYCQIEHAIKETIELARQVWQLDGSPRLFCFD